VAASTAIATALLSACGSGTHTTTAADGPTAAAARAARTITMLMADVPSLDPVVSTSAQQAEVDWLVYTGLTTYRHAPNAAGTQLMAGLASSLPRVGDEGRTYTVSLRPGLRFSNGRRLAAADFVTTVERALVTRGSAVRGPLIATVEGAAAFAEHRARSISGIAADNATGRITIRLLRRDGAFDALLARPALGIVPGGTPLNVAADDPPVGIGPYRIERVVPGRSFELMRNPRWRPQPGIPAGHLDIDVTLSSDVAANVLSVLNDVSDVYVAAQPIGRRLLGEVRAKAPGRLAELGGDGPVDYVFLDSRRAPFEHLLAREAVLVALGDDTFSAPSVIAGCELLPTVLVGPTPARCRYRTATGDGPLARALVRRSGTAGDSVVVWSPPREPMRGWMSRYVTVLRAIGYDASLRVVPGGAYQTSISIPAIGAQTGIASWSAQGSGPWALYRVLDGHAITSSRNENASEIDNARIDAAISALIRVPATDRPAIASGWRTVEQDVGRQADLYVIGEQKTVQLVSARLDAAAAIVNPIEGLDLSSLSLH
jgi:peptide/nickel transport system substrate-binding protein